MYLHFKHSPHSADIQNHDLPWCVLPTFSSVAVIIIQNKEKHNLAERSGFIDDVRELYDFSCLLYQCCLTAAGRSVEQQIGAWYILTIGTQLLFPDTARLTFSCPMMRLSSFSRFLVEQGYAHKKLVRLQIARSSPAFCGYTKACGTNDTPGSTYDAAITGRQLRFSAEHTLLRAKAFLLPSSSAHRHTSRAS